MSLLTDLKLVLLLLTQKLTHTNQLQTSISCTHILKPSNGSCQRRTTKLLYCSLASFCFIFSLRPHPPFRRQPAMQNSNKLGSASLIRRNATTARVNSSCVYNCRVINPNRDGLNPMALAMLCITQQPSWSELQGKRLRMKKEMYIHCGYFFLTLPRFPLFYVVSV